MIKLTQMTDIEIKLKLQGEGASTNTYSSLQEWIRKGSIMGLQQVEAQVGQSPPQHMGMDPVTLLSVVLGSKAITELIKSIHGWIQATRPKVKIKINVDPKGEMVTSLEIDAENLPEIKQLLDETMRKLPTLDSED